MKTLILAVALSLSTAPALACNSFGPDYDPTPCRDCAIGYVWQSCDAGSFGPAPCIEQCVPAHVAPLPTGPAELCLPAGCTPISYDWQGDMAIASTVLSSGYPVIGWAGPCRSADRQCPDILNQAADDLRVNALRANRAQGF